MPDKLSQSIFIIFLGNLRAFETENDDMSTLVKAAAVSVHGSARDPFWLSSIRFRSFSCAGILANFNDTSGHGLEARLNQLENVSVEEEEKKYWWVK